MNLKEAWADIQNGQVYIYGMHISPYEKGNIFNKDPFRVRRLLLHKKEIVKLSSKIQQDGLTLVPLSLYYKNQYVKVELGLCKGKKLYDKREADAKKNAKRDIDRALKTQSRR